MRTNGSQNGHIQVDRQTIETALDDEGAGGASVIRRSQEATPSGNTNQTEKPKKKAVALQPQQPPDLLDILDHFLITPSNPEETSSLVASSAVANPISQVSPAALQMDHHSLSTSR